MPTTFAAPPPAKERCGRTGVVLVRTGLGLLFASAGTIKLAGLSAFAGIVGGYGLLPKFLHFPAALALALTEIAAGAGLALGKRYCLETIAVMLALFAGVLGYGILLGLDVDCGCFVPSTTAERFFDAGLRQALWRDAALLGVCAWLFWRRQPRAAAAGEFSAPNPSTASGGKHS